MNLSLSDATVRANPVAQKLRRHVVITGTGRTGTTFLVELLTHCGLDTGFSATSAALLKDPIARAGLELDLRAQAAPYIVKSPWFCDYADEVFQRDDIRIEHVLIPMRDLYEAAQSRRHVQTQRNTQLPSGKRLTRWLRQHLLGRGPRAVAGGLWPAARGIDQERVLLGQLYKLLYTLSEQDIPVTLLQFPRTAHDSGFLYRKLQFLLGDMSYAEFDAIHRRTVRRDLIHRFATN